jgi:hypothetical protein
MPPVLSTPWLIWFLEYAARESVVLSLEPGESTVLVGSAARNLPLEGCCTTPQEQLAGRTPPQEGPQAKSVSLAHGRAALAQPVGPKCKRQA